MKSCVWLAAAAALLLSLQAGAQAQTTLRIGLAEDPDILDPDAGAHLCRPHRVRGVLRQAVRHRREAQHRAAARAVARDVRRRQGRSPSSCGPGVKFHDGEPFDAEAAKFSLERHLTMPGSFRKPELAALDHVDVVDPLTIKLRAEGAVLAADRAAHRPRRHDGLAEGGEGGRRQVRPASRSAPVPTNSSSACSRTASCSRNSPTTGTRTTSTSTAIVFLPIVDATVRLANLKSGGLDLIERVLATDIKDGAARPEAETVDRARARLSGRHASTSARTRPRVRSASPPRCGRRSTSSIDREAINQVVFNGEFKPGNQWVNPRASLLPEGLPGPQARCRQGQGAAEGSRRHAAGQRRLHGAEGRGDRGGRAGDPVDGGGSRLRPEDPGHRIRDLAEAGRGRRIPGLSCWLERPHRSRRQLLRLPAHPTRRRTTAPAPTPRPTRRSTMRGWSPIRRKRKAIYEKLTEGCARRRADPLSLSPQDPDRAHHQARRLQADAGRAGARDRAEAEVSVTRSRARDAVSGDGASPQDSLLPAKRCGAGEERPC